MQDRGAQILLHPTLKSKNDSMLSRGIICLNGMKGLYRLKKRENVWRAYSDATLEDACTYSVSCPVRTREQ